MSQKSSASLASTEAAASQLDALSAEAVQFPLRVALGFPASKDSVFEAVKETLREMGFETFERLEPERGLLLTGAKLKEMALREETRHQVAAAVITRSSDTDVYAKVLCYRGRRGKWKPIARPAKCLEDLLPRVARRLGAAPGSRLP